MGRAVGADRFQQVLAGIRVVKAFSREDNKHASFVASVDAAHREALHSQQVR